jgi:hypothetical protein
LVKNGNNDIGLGAKVMTSKASAKTKAKRNQTRFQIHKGAKSEPLKSLSINSNNMPGHAGSFRVRCPENRLRTNHHTSLLPDRGSFILPDPSGAGHT